LTEYVTKNNKKIYTKLDDNNIETIGLLSSFFTYVAQRLLDIYYAFNKNNMLHRNEEMFKKIFIEDKKYSIIFYTLGKMKGIHKHKQINVIEMRKFLKYHMIASDVWKLANEIIKFELQEVNVISTVSNKLIKCFC
jgi:hypothetical protein